MLKTCKKCEKSLPLTAEFFHRKKELKDGFRSVCKECRKNEESKEVKNYRNKEWKKRNQQKIKAYVRPPLSEEAKLANAERRKLYDEKNKELVSLRRRERYLKRREEISIKAKEKYILDSEYMRERQRQWRMNNPIRSKEIDRKKHHKRKSIMKKLDYDYTESQWALCLVHFDNSCAYCGSQEVLAREHFIPVSKGGEYTVNNIIPACQSCNSRKNNKNFFDWYISDKAYSEIREAKILSYLNYTKNIQQLSIL